VMSSLVSTYIDWEGFLANPRYIRAGNEITWAGRGRTFLPEVVTPEYLCDLIEAKQYTFQTLDNGSVLQFYYLFNDSGDEIEAATLAYYSAPGAMSDETELTAETGEEIADNEIVSWLRNDFSPRTARGVLHHDCHLHVSGFRESRLLVRRLPTPKQFTEFVVAICHPQQYRCHRLDENGAYVDMTRLDAINREVFEC